MVFACVEMVAYCALTSSLSSAAPIIATFAVIDESSDAAFCMCYHITMADRKVLYL